MTTAIETALTELLANLRRMEQRHQATGYKFDRLYGLIDAAREELAGLTEKAALYTAVRPYLCNTCSGFGLVDRRCADDPLGSEPCPQCSPSPDSLAASICRRVSELDDRNSPADWPEAMLVTGDELSSIVRDVLTGVKS